MESLDTCQEASRGSLANLEKAPMTRHERKALHRSQVIEQKEMLVALVEVWVARCKKIEYDPEVWAYLRDLKRRKRIMEQRVKAFSS